MDKLTDDVFGLTENIKITIIDYIREYFKLFKTCIKACFKNKVFLIKGDMEIKVPGSALMFYNDGRKYQIIFNRIYMRGPRIFKSKRIYSMDNVQSLSKVFLFYALVYRNISVNKNEIYRNYPLVKNTIKKAIPDMVGLIYLEFVRLLSIDNSSIIF